jgi:hypothetical protein
VDTELAASGVEGNEAVDVQCGITAVAAAGELEGAVTGATRTVGLPSGSLPQSPAEPLQPPLLLRVLATSGVRDIRVAAAAPEGLRSAVLHFQAADFTVDVALPDNSLLISTGTAEGSEVRTPTDAAAGCEFVGSDDHVHVRGNSGGCIQLELSLGGRPVRLDVRLR